jgi:hypothetical protein
MKFASLAVFSVAVALTGCAATGTKFAQQETATPKLSQDMGRVYFYRSSSMFGAALRPNIKFDGGTVGESLPGGYFYVDAKPGSHEAETSTEASNKVSFVLEKGETKYVRTKPAIGILVGRVVPELVGPEEAQKELVDLSFTGAPR